MFKLNPDGSLKGKASSIPAGEHSRNPQGSVRSLDGKWLYVADWGSGSVTGYSIRQDGRLGDPKTVKGASPAPVTPSSIAISPAGRHLYTANYSNGRAGTVSHFRLTDDGTPQAVSTTLTHGRGTTGLAVSPDGHTLITSNATSGDVSSYSVGEDGTLKWVMTLPTGRGAFFPAITPDSHSAVITNSKANTLSLLKISASSRLSLVNSIRSQGPEPRGIVLNRSGSLAYVANFNNGTGPGSVSTVRVDLKGIQHEGKAVATGSNGTEGIALAQDGGTVYAANFNKNGKGSVTTFPLDSKGALGQPRPPVATGGRQPDLTSITVPYSR
ncbi:beta-propeller fold lactonase family protein [Streptomyces sp. Lzd4kr]|nr:beta-propeller fold lactonase family protein [Streptomyces sp. Lzd4kr]